MTFGISATTAIGGTALLGGAASLYGAKQQASAARDASSNALNEFGQIKASEQPYMTAGAGATGKLGSLLGISGDASAPGYGSLTHQFNASDLQSNLAPNYQWQLNQGQMANQNMANASGGLVGGNAMTGLQDYTQNFAGNAYQNAFNNYNTGQSNIFNRLNSIAGLGQNAASNTGAMGTQATQSANDYLTGAAAANAGGMMGAANAIGGAANMGLNYSLANKYLNGKTDLSGGIPGAAGVLSDPGVSNPLVAGG